MKLAVTGAGGFMGSRLTGFYKKKYETTPDFTVTGYTHDTLDFTSEETVKQVLGRDRPDILIHTAAVSDIGACERNPVLSEAVNAEGVKYLADICAEQGIRMIFCSSDQVYMGSAEELPHREEEEGLDPPTLYAQQKLRAEKYILQHVDEAVILRLSWMYAADYEGRREHGNLLSDLAKAAKEGRELSYPVCDYRSITDVWEVIKNMEKMFDAPPGIYNFGSENNLSTYDLINEMCEKTGRGKWKPQKNTAAFAGHPRNLRMDMEKCRSIGIEFRNASDALCSVPSVF